MKVPPTFSYVITGLVPVIPICRAALPFRPRVKPEEDGRDKPGHDKEGALGL
jgi:hypothetical protein